MKFCYCRECKILRPKNWYSGKSCDICEKDCTIFNVPRTMFGWAMYILDGLAVALIVLYFARFQMGWDWASVISGVESSTLVIVIFALIFASFVLAFIDIGKMTEKAKRMVGSGVMGKPPSR